MQATIARAASFEGVGVHGGERAEAVIRPGAANSGIVFRRTDVAAREPRRNPIIPARFDHVVDTRLCTVLANEDGVSVSTVEHLMAALAGVGVSNALIDIDGPEVPIMDGSAEPFVRGLRASGVRAQGESQCALRVLRGVEVVDGEKRAALTPCARFEMRFEIDFSDEAIGRQERSLTLVNGAFVDQLSRARTFGRLAEVEALRAAGLGRGGSLENAIVVDGARILNADGLRYDDEFVRHKMLDAVGDLALAGAPILGRYEGVRAGHEMTNRLLRALFSEPDAYEWVDYDRAGPIALGVHIDHAA